MFENSNLVNIEKNILLIIILVAIVLKNSIFKNFENSKLTFENSNMFEIIKICLKNI